MAYPEAITRFPESGTRGWLNSLAQYPTDDGHISKDTAIHFLFFIFWTYPHVF
jgi:hypothetical protein